MYLACNPERTEQQYKKKKSLCKVAPLPAPLCVPLLCCVECATNNIYQDCRMLRPSGALGSGSASLLTDWTESCWVQSCCRKRRLRRPLLIVFVCRVWSIRVSCGGSVVAVRVLLNEGEVVLKKMSTKSQVGALP